MSTLAEQHTHKRRNSREILQYAKRIQEKYLLHQFWIDKTMGKKIAELGDLPDVDIAEAGRFKYVLVDVQDRDTVPTKSKLVVRGDASSAYHADVLELLQEQVDESRLKLNCLGGGRIRVDPQTRKISVYGYSMGFGRADHEKTVEILKKSYPQWTIKITEEEY